MKEERPPHGCHGCRGQESMVALLPGTLSVPAEAGLSAAGSDPGLWPVLDHAGVF